MKNLKRLIGKKCGMTQRFDANGHLVPCTVIYIEPNVVTQVKTVETDGYSAIQVACDKVASDDDFKQAQKVGKPMLGHFKKAGVTARRKAIEARLDDVSSYQLGQELGVSAFEGTQFVDVTGVSKGKGYQGVMKLHGFSGGPASHGSGFHRHAGSTGMRSTPGRSLPNSPRASQMGNRRVTVQSLKIVAIYPEKGILLIKGQIPGPTGATVYVQEACKK